MENIRVISFPKDDKIRVVWWYGSMIPNTSAKSTNPLVKILLKEVCLLDDELVFVNNSDLICHLPLPELDYVLIGSLWKNQQQLHDVWHYNNHLELEPFECDFTKHKPQSITYSSLSSLNHQQYFEINPSDHTQHYNNQLKSFIPMSTQQIYDQLYHTRLVKLVTNRDITVFVPAFVYLSGAIFPRHKGLRRDIINYPLDTFLSRHLNSSKIIDGVYHVDTIKKLEKINAATLSYCALNPITHERLKLINDSLQTGSYDNGKNPIILPFHPSSLSIMGEGLWIDSEHKTFLLLRIKSFNFPNEVKIVHTSTFTAKKKDRGKNIPLAGDDDTNDVEHEDPNSENTIENGTDPSGKGPTKHIRSTVDISFPNESFKVVSFKTEDSKNIVDVFSGNIDEKETASSHIHEEIKDNHLSSGESNASQDSKDINRLEMDGSSRNMKPKMNNLRSRISEMEQLIGGVIAQIRYVDTKGSEHEKIIYCTIPKSIYSDDDVADYSWCYLRKRVDSITSIKKTKSFLRLFVIMKVILNDGRFAYFLEMERKRSENYSGLCFQCSGALTENVITKLWSIIVSNKGVFKRNNADLPLMPLNVAPAKPYVHSSYDKVIRKLDGAGMFG